MTTGRRLFWTGVVVAGLIGSSAALVLLSAAFKSLGSTRLYAALVGVFLLTGLGAYFLTVRVILPFWTGSTTRKNGIVAFSITAGAAFALFMLPVLPTNDVLFPKHSLRIEATGERHPASTGSQVALAWFVTEYSEVNFLTLKQSGEWQRVDGALVSQGNQPANLTWRGTVGASATLVFKTGPDAGMVDVAWSGMKERIDLYALQAGEYTFTQEFRVTLLDRALFWVPLGLMLAFGLLVLLILLASRPATAALPASPTRRALAAMTVLAGVIMFVRFFFPIGNEAGRQWFNNYDRFSEGLILGRMVMSGQEGLLAAGGLPGYIVPPGGKGTTYSSAYQYQAYLEGLPYDAFVPYRSQSGGQGMLFSLLDVWLPLPKAATFDLFHALTALASATAIALVVRWFAQEFGLATGAVVLASAIFSQWLAVFARNLWWSMWAFYLPMIVMLTLFRPGRGQPAWTRVALVALGALFVKVLFNGFEYLTTTLVMMGVPLVFTFIVNNEPITRWVKPFTGMALGSAAALGFGITLLGWQTGSLGDSQGGFLPSLLATLQERTGGASQPLNVELQACLEGGVTGVLRTYVNGTYLDAGHFLKLPGGAPLDQLSRVSYGILTLFFLISTGILWLNRERWLTRADRRKASGLMAATWFSLLAPLSWYVIFIQHSCVHPHLNMIVWQMPFTLFGFATVGVLLSVATAGWRSRRASKGQENDAQAHHPNEK